MPPNTIICNFGESTIKMANKQTASNQTSFWPSCGYELLSINDENRLRISDDFLRHLYWRPELEPIEASCTNERVLHQALLDSPTRAVSANELNAIADADARENYQFALLFRDLLLANETLEAAYLQLISGQFKQSLPPIFIEYLVQILLRHILHNGKSDADSIYQARAAELLFRCQKVSLDNGIMLADAEMIARQQPQAMTVLQSLIQQAGGVSADTKPNLEVLNKYTLTHYKQHSESHDLVISLNKTEPGIGAFCRVLEKWLAHLHTINSKISPLNAIQDDHWRWHIGLDSESNRILNQLYEQQTLTEDDQYRLLGLFKLEFDEPKLLRSDMQGYPIYLGLAMDENNELRVKPQNLLMNLPTTAII